MNRKKVILLILLFVLLLALVYAFWATPTVQHVESKRTKKGSIAGSVPAEMHNRVVKLELLDKEPQPFEGIQRDLFGDLFPRPKVVKKTPPPPKPRPVVKPLPVQIEKPTPVEIVRRDLARFTFMGYLRKQERWTMFLSANDEIFLVQEGDRFGRNDQFHAVEITPEQLVVEQATQGRIVVPLVEKQALVPSSFPAESSTRGDVRSSARPSIVPEATGQPSSAARPFRSNPFGGRRTLPAGAPAVHPTTPTTSPNNEVSNE